MYTILGIDLGNYAVKVSNGNIFVSKCAKVGNLLSSTKFTTDQGTFYIGDGSFDMEYKKINKEYIRTFFLYALACSTNEKNNHVKTVVGLPISQYKEDKDKLQSMLRDDYKYKFTLNGRAGEVFIEDLEVYPEGIAAIIGTDFEGIIIDVGGRTTDCCRVVDIDGTKKIENAFSEPIGTLNLYSEFIKSINSKGYDLKLEDAQRILKKGLKDNGDPVNIDFAYEVIDSFVENLTQRLKIDYSLRTEEILLIGGGGEMLFDSFSKRLNNLKLIENSVFANANAFKRAGDMLWQ